MWLLSACRSQYHAAVIQFWSEARRSEVRCNSSVIREGICIYSHSSFPLSHMPYAENCAPVCERERWKCTPKPLMSSLRLPLLVQWDLNSPNRLSPSPLHPTPHHNIPGSQPLPPQHSFPLSAIVPHRLQLFAPGNGYQTARLSSPQSRLVEGQAE